MILTSRLDPDHGGLTASLLRKSAILNRELGICPQIATFHDAAGFPEVCADLRTRYALPPEIEFTNINHHYRAQPTPPDAPTGPDALSRICADLPGYEARYTYDAAGAPFAATITVDGQAARRVYFRPDGSVFEVRPGDGSPKAAAAQKKAGAAAEGSNGAANSTSDGQTGALAAGAVSAEAKQVAARAAQITAGCEIVLDPLTSREQRFKTFDGFRRHFMDELCQGPLTYFICEARLLDKALLSLENRQARKIFVFHSVHIRPGTDIIRVGNRALLKNLSQADALVLLTGWQKQDVADRFGYADRLHVIPHATQLAAAGGERDPNKLAVVSRLNEEKNLGDSIRALQQVRQVHPQAHLEIWGSGPEEASLKSLAQELDLAEAVHFAGYSKQAQQAFDTAAVSLLTSRWEGFSLTVMESMAHGAPCVAYNTKYGPAEMIIDGVNGYLVEPGNVEQLAERVAGLLSLPAADWQAMSQAAADRMREFSEARLAERWQSLFESLRQPVAVRPPLLKRAWRRVPRKLREPVGRILSRS
ncbi:MAG: glycosyltransferase [Bifidobacteriaceae bacterium]|nr:glycosyltransferase [Bifidobacteriaceae bacterium]